MKRHQFRHDGLTLSYLDQGGTGALLIALHAHWMEASTYAALADALAPTWRVVSLDQRGHGDSDHAQSYTRDDYLSDLTALYRELAASSAVLLGNSLGGVNAYQYAARHPERVRALIIEDIGAEVHADTSFVLAWQGTFPTREALAERIGARLAPYLQPSFRESADGWQLAFDPREHVLSQQALVGDHWQDWLGSDCPALLLRGMHSHMTEQHQLEQMAERRPHTRLETLAGGHVLHIDNARRFTQSVQRFLSSLYVRTAGRPWAPRSVTLRSRSSRVTSRLRSRRWPHHRGVSASATRPRCSHPLARRPSRSARAATSRSPDPSP
ncbi:MAG: 2-(acetamidomethylene)succinate hydrolase [Myxococcaceae bacterium]|nr:2-(acetamidomethylene)succinate hydrolase [Myxococcaceae bacterium]